MQILSKGEFVRVSNLPESESSKFPALTPCALPVYPTSASSEETAMIGKLS